MKVLLLSTYEKTGGAAIAASRLLQALRHNGVEATMLCRKNISVPWLRRLCPSLARKLEKQSWTSIMERVVIWVCNGFSMKDLWATDIALFGQDITKTKEYKEADVIHLHWINQGFLSLKTLKEIIRSGKRIVITMHDDWFFSSVYHVVDSNNCEISPKGLHSYIYRQKIDIFANAAISIVAVSSWHAKKIESSNMFKGRHVEVVPNMLPCETAEYDHWQCRTELGISSDDIVIVFCASRLDDHVKDLPMLIISLEHLTYKHPEWKDHLVLRLVGELKDKTILKNIHIKHICLGSLSHNEISREFCAADALACTSYSETFGQTLIEAQAVGTMPVSFSNGGQTDIITHKVNGYLVEQRTASEFARGLEWAISEGKYFNRESISKKAKEKYSPSRISKLYTNIYR